MTSAQQTKAERDRAFELLRQCLGALRGDEPDVVAARNAVDEFLAGFDREAPTPNAEEPKQGAEVEERSDASGDHARSETAPGSNAAQDATMIQEGQVSGTIEDKSLDRLARLRARAREVNHTDKAARVRFMAGLGGEWVRGETAAVLAEEWGMKLATVETDASIAGLLIKLQADPEVAHSAYWQDVYEELEQMQPLRRRAAEVLQEGLDEKLYERMMGPDGVEIVVVSPKGIKDLSDALAALAQSTDRCREKIGKASGLLTSTTTINVNTVFAAAVPFEPFGAPAKVEAIMEFARTLFELAMRSDDPKQRLGAAEALRAGRGLPPLVEAKVVDDAGE